MKKIDYISHILIVITAVMFIAFYLCLSFYNRPASDDLAFISMAQGQSLFASVTEIFNTWSGRWTSWTYLFAVLSSSKFENTPLYIFIYYTFTLLLLSYSTTILTRALIKKMFSITIEYKIAFVYGILFIAAFFYFTIDHIEAWWWLSATFYYLQGIVFLLFGLAILIREKKNILHYLLIALSFIYVGACFEIYILILFCLFGLVGLYYLKNKSQETFIINYKAYKKAVVVAFLSFFISACICFSAPGNINRQESVFRLEVSKQESTSVISYFQKKHILALGISSLFMLLGMRIRRETNHIINSKKIVLVAGIPVLVSILVTYVFQLIILKDFAVPLRGLTFTSFTGAVFFCLLFVCMGYSYKKQKSELVGSIIKIVFPLLVVIVLMLVLMKQYKYTSRYAEAYDELIVELVQAKNDNTEGTIYIVNLPASGMLTPLNIDDDYDKIPLKKILGIEYEIIVDK